MDQKLIDFLAELKSYGIDQNIPNVTERGGRFLNMLIKLTKAQSILEIGCANGYSTIWMADAVSQNGGKIYSIDHSHPTFESAKENLLKVELADFVDFSFGNALDVIPTIHSPDYFDFVFVDGEKRSYWDFWEAIFPRLSKHAVVVFDDIISFPHKTKLFLEKIKNISGFDQLILPIDGNDGILVLIKN